MIKFRFTLFLLLCFEFVSCNNATVKNTTSTTEDEILTQPAAAGYLMPSAVEFPSLDGLPISAVLWEVDKNSPTILLCHQNGSNYHEYDEVAPKLNRLGYNCLAIDQRAGGVLFDIVNQTADRAISENLSVTYWDAEQDIIAGIDYAAKLYNKPIILFGSSYSAGFALHLAQDNKNVRAAIAFSPGDYFENEKPPLNTTMRTFTKPFFITSAKFEVETVSAFLQNSLSDSLHVQFIPSHDGKHGAKTLWEDIPNNDEYWSALTVFLNTLDN